MQQMKILVVEPGRRPRPAEIDGTLESMREIVGGRMQAMYPTEDIALVFNNNRNVPLLPQNRGVRNNIVRGTFFLCGAPEDGNYFVSLTDGQIRHYAEAFALPEVFLGLGDRTIILPTRKESSKIGTKELWIRLGATIKITDAEEQQIFGNDDPQMEETLRLVIAEGRFCPDGETYIPSESVHEFNRTYETLHDEENWCCDL